MHEYSYVLCLAGMRCKILLTVFLRSDDLKRLIISEHGKNDAADFMYDSPDSHVFLLAFAFAGIAAVDHRIYWCFRPFIHLKVIECYHMQDAPGKSGTALGHADFVTVELAGLLYGRLQTEVSIKLLWGNFTESTYVSMDKIIYDADKEITAFAREILPGSKEIENIPTDEGYLLEVLP